MSKEEIALELTKEHFKMYNGSPSSKELVDVYLKILERLSKKEKEK